MADFTEFVPELGVTERDIVVTKRNPSAFYGIDLDLQLRRRNIARIAIGGISTIQITGQELAVAGQSVSIRKVVRGGASIDRYHTVSRHDEDLLRYRGVSICPSSRGRCV